MGAVSAQLESGPLTAGARRRRSELGVAAVIAIMALLLMTALGVAINLTVTSETMIAGNFLASAEAFYAADAVGERAIDDLRTVADWTLVLSGEVRSAFVDGAPEGTRRLADGKTIDLTSIVNLANCNKATACRDADMNAVTTARPWGVNNPRWQLYAYGELNRMAPGAITSPYYVLAMVADDGSEDDGDPLRDGTDGINPGAGVLALRAEAFGARGAHKAIEMTLAHPPAVRLLSWRSLR